MRIALLTYSTKPRGGVVHTLALAEALAELAPEQDVEVDVWTLGRGGDRTFFRPVDPRVTVHAVPFPQLEGEAVGPRILRSIDVLGAAFTPADYDVVHAQDCISANAVGCCIRTIHHLEHFTTPELAACHERAIVRPYAHLCVSSSVAQEVRDGWGIQPTVIPNGVDASRFAAAAADPRAQQPWRDRFGEYVLAVGGIEPRKGSLDLLRAFAVVRMGRLGLSLVFAGGETLFDYRDYRAEFDRVAEELSIEPVVLGPVDHDQLPGLVAASAAFGFVSLKEGFGLAAMEALAAGVGVVVRDLPVFREVFADHVRYADSVTGMAAVLEQTVGESPPPGGAAFAASHSWVAAARAHLEFYRTRLSPA